MLFEVELARKMEAQQREFEARLAQELARQEARCEEELQLKIMSMQPGLPSKTQEPVEMQEMKSFTCNVSLEPQEGTKEDEMAPLLEEPLIPYQVSDGEDGIRET